MNTKNTCLHMVEGPDQLIPDYHPVSLKQAKKQLKEACKGHTHVGTLTGLRFRLDHLSQEDINKFHKYGNNICNQTLEKWNLKK